MGDHFLAHAQPFTNLFLISQLAFHAKITIKGNSKIQFMIITPPKKKFYIVTI